MKSKNICKSIPISSADKLDTHQFIYETDVLVMNTQWKLKCNRIILVKSGSVIFNVDSYKISAEAGSIVFVFDGESFCPEAEKGAEYFYIDFSGNRCDALFRRFGINVGVRAFKGYDGLIPFWHDSLLRASNENIDLLAESVLLYTLSRLKCEEKENGSIIQQIIDITEENFADPQLSIAEVSKMLCYNSKYLSHLFKQKMGVGYTEYLRVFRINYAIVLIEHGIDSVKNIASLCGFSNPQYFSSVFKNIVGVSPVEYKSSKK